MISACPECGAKVRRELPLVYCAKRCGWSAFERRKPGARVESRRPSAAPGTASRATPRASTSAAEVDDTSASCKLAELEDQIEDRGGVRRGGYRRGEGLVQLLILGLFEKRPGAVLTTKKIHAALAGQPFCSVKSALSTLADRGVLIRVSRGEYRATGRPSCG